MFMPIQAPPIDRSNRAISQQSARAEGIGPAQFDPGVILPTVCAICKIFPKIPICPVLCPT